METALKIIWGILLLMMLFYIWPAYKKWREEKHQAEAGDWGNLVFILGLVLLFVSLLIWSVM